MSVSNDLVMDRWEYHVRYRRAMTSRQGRELSTNGNNILSHGDTLYSYGTHFVLAQANRDARGNIICLLLNGDRFSVTTSKHQSWTRGVCGRLANDLGVPTIIVPFTALHAAGVDPDDVEPIHVRADRTITHHHSTKERPGALCDMDDPDGRTVVGERHCYSGTLDRETGIYFECVSQEPAHWREWPSNPTSPEDFIEHDARPFPDEPSVLGDKDGWRAWRERYGRGTSRTLPVRKPLRVPNPNQCQVGRSAWVTADFDGETWRWERQQHLLGDSLFRARVREWVTVRPTPEQRTIFDEWTRLVRERQTVGEQMRDMRAQQAIGGYRYRRGHRRQFLSQPRDYRQMLRYAWAYDVLSDKDDALNAQSRERREALAATMGDHSWRDRGGLHIERRRTRKPIFLSSFDYQESTPLYFLCELPHGARPETVEEAIDALKPPEVVAAEARGLKVTRQGDLFAIPTRLNKRQIRRMRNARHDFEKRLRVLGTNHSVTEGVIARGGAVLGRGIMRHEPDDFRNPDHARQRMGDGKTWHLLVRNTVPRQ